MSSLSRGSQFEDKVREVCCALWNLPASTGAEIIAEQEIDVVCRTDDLTHLVMCTMSRALIKVKEDATKLVFVRNHLQQRGETVKAWIVTQDDPTPEQRSAGRFQGITVLSYRQLSSRVIDAQQYLSSRAAFRFGSATDLRTGNSKIADDEYVPSTILQQDTGVEYNVPDLAQALLKGNHMVLLGPFGAGKSITVREIFRDLRARHLRQETDMVPIPLNLRDHWGQNDPAEALHRHAKRLGFEKPDQLVRAWNAGRLVVLLDGFDELASQSLATRPELTRANRRQAVSLVREFALGARGRTGLLIAGRDHYFDSDEEMRSALGLVPETVELEISEFTEDQAAAFLAAKGFEQELPAWLPRKPLLLGYLATENLLIEVLGIDGERGNAHAWRQFLSKICQREAEISGDIEPEAVGQILEDLATITRRKPQGAAPLSESEMATAYRSITGRDPLESARVLLGRLPGLTARDQEAGSRSFVDADMLEALRGGWVARFISSPFNTDPQGVFFQPLGELGYETTALITLQNGIDDAMHGVAAREAIGRWHEPSLALDCICSGSRRNAGRMYDAEGLNVSGGWRALSTSMSVRCPASPLNTARSTY